MSKKVKKPIRGCPKECSVIIYLADLKNIDSPPFTTGYWPQDIAFITSNRLKVGFISQIWTRIKTRNFFHGEGTSRKILNLHSKCKNQKNKNIFLF